MKLDAKLVALGWLDLQSLDLGSDEYREGSWAFEVVLDALMHDGKYCWDIIGQVLEIDSDGKHLQALAVGILDDYLSSYGAQMIARIEAKAGENANFRTALRNVTWTCVDRQVGKRLQQFLTR
jgi:hypothetical protein